MNNLKLFYKSMMKLQDIKSISSTITFRTAVYNSKYFYLTPNLTKRHSSTTSSPTSIPPVQRKMSALEIQHLKRKGRKITMITAYDYPSAMHANYADFDILLVGDSVGMV